MSNYRRACPPNLRRKLPPRTISVEALKPMTPYETMLREHARRHDAVICAVLRRPTAATLACHDCGKPLTDLQVYWMSEHVGVCDACYYDAQGLAPCPTCKTEFIDPADPDCTICGPARHEDR